MASKTKQGNATQNLAKAISHPLRSEILTILTQRTASPTEIAKELGETNEKANVGSVDHHVKRLLELECAELVSTRPVRGTTEHFYKAAARNFLDLEDAQKLHPALTDHYAGHCMRYAIADLNEAAEGGSLKTQEDLQLTSNQVVLDQEGWERALEIHERARLEIEKEEERSIERMTRSGETKLTVSTSQMCFRMPATTSAAK